MKALLADLIICDRCGGDLSEQEGLLACTRCDRTIPLQDGIPIFTPSPQGLRPSEKLRRSPDSGTPWRRANWRFLAGQAAQLPPEAVILDVGAGRGDFADLFRDLPGYLALDVYPYPEVDLACDLTLANPFREASFDAVLLMNVLEHVYDARTLLARLAMMLKPGGVLVVAVPFMVKMHQVPVDFARYTHYALQRLGAEHGLEVAHLDGFYDPISVLVEGTGNLRNAVIPTLPGLRRFIARVLWLYLQVSADILRGVLGPGQVAPPALMRTQAPTGYHVIYRKAGIGSSRG
jgi:SAM-dependent methyltransferase